jgi:hypothetical protein
VYEQHPKKILTPFEGLGFNPKDDPEYDLDEHVHVILFRDPKRKDHQFWISQLAYHEFTIVVVDHGKDIGIKGWLPYDQVSYINEIEIETKLVPPQDHVAETESDWVKLEFDSESDLWTHAQTAHEEQLLKGKNLEAFKESFVAASASKKSGSVRPKHFRTS